MPSTDRNSLLYLCCFYLNFVYLQRVKLSLPNALNSELNSEVKVSCRQSGSHLPVLPSGTDTLRTANWPYPTCLAIDATDLLIHQTCDEVRRERPSSHQICHEPKWKSASANAKLVFTALLIRDNPTLRRVPWGGSFVNVSLCQTHKACLLHLFMVSLQEPQHGQTVGHQDNLSRFTLLELQHSSQHHVHFNPLDCVCLVRENVECLANLSNVFWKKKTWKILIHVVMSVWVHICPG